MSRTIRPLLLFSVIACVAASVAHAAIPRTIYYQGKLTEPDGTPLVGEQTIIVRLYDAPEGGTKLWEEQHAVALTRADNGIFSVVLGSQTPFGDAMAFNDPLWLTIEINNGGEFAPRQLLSSASYALNADQLDGLDSSQFLRADAPIGSEGLAKNSVGADALSAGAIQPGDIEVGDLPAHTHEGLHSIAVSGQPAILGDAIVAAGSNVTLSQAGQTITIGAAAAAGGGGTTANRASASASNALAVGTAADTTLVSVSFTKSQANSVVLVIGSVQLTHTGNPNEKTVDVKLVRDGTLLDGAYTAHLGKAAGAVADLPVTVQAWDTSGAGPHTLTLQARANGAGATANLRRLTVLELP